MAVDAWQAFTAPQPDGLMAIAMARSPELRFTGEAFGRLMQEYPAQSDGLSLTERRILLAAAESGAIVGGVFRAISEAERRPFLADLPYLSRVGTLAKVERPGPMDRRSPHDRPRAAVALRRTVGATPAAALRAHLCTCAASPGRWLPT